MKRTPSLLFDIFGQQGVAKCYKVDGMFSLFLFLLHKTYRTRNNIKAIRPSCCQVVQQYVQHIESHPATTKPPHNALSSFVHEFLTRKLKFQQQLFDTHPLLPVIYSRLCHSTVDGTRRSLWFFFQNSLHSDFFCSNSLSTTLLQRTLYTT